MLQVWRPEEMVHMATAQMVSSHALTLQNVYHVARYVTRRKIVQMDLMNGAK